MNNTPCGNDSKILDFIPREKIRIFPNAPNYCVRKESKNRKLLRETDGRILKMCSKDRIAGVELI